MTHTPLTIGIIGLGNIAHQHADDISALGHTLAGGVDVDPDARDRFTTNYDVPTYSDVTDLFTSELDAVIITTPNKYHEEYAIAALEAGYDVFLEKPLAHTLTSARRIADAARDAENFCMVGFHNRFREGVEALKAYHDAGRFGTLTHIEANYVRRRGIPGRGSWFTSEAIAGGGALIDIGVHILDLALYFHGFPDIEEVMAVTRSQFGDRDDYTYLEMWGDDSTDGEFTVEDAVSGFIRCANGKTIAVEVAWAANRPPNTDVVFRGTEGGAVLDHGADEVTVYETAADGAPHFLDTAVRTAGTDAHQAELAMFCEAVREGVAPDRNTVTQALQVQEVIDALYRSAACGEAVSVE